MEIKEMQKVCCELNDLVHKKHGANHEPDSIFLSLVEEVGEVARELSHKGKNWRKDFNKENLADELADIVTRVAIIAEDNEIDLEAAIVGKMDKYRKRFDLK